jgi:hypothetical protein
MGASDILEVFSIYGQASTSSAEKSRALIQFPISDIAAKRSAGDLPVSGSVNWYLRLFNAEHSETSPSQFTLVATSISQSWTEGYGLDMNGYTDPGLGNGGYGATWNARTKGAVSAGSVELNGSDQWLTVAHAANLSFGNALTESAFSLSAWINIDNTTKQQPIISKWSSANTGAREWAFFVDENGALSFTVADESVPAEALAQAGDGAIAPSAWYHVAVTYDGLAGATPFTNLKMYINGTVTGSTITYPVGSGAYLAMESLTGQTASIGALNYSGEYPYDGKLDEISIWKKQLTQAEVTDLYNSGCPTDLRFHSAYKSDSTNLVAWWRFETDNVSTADTSTTVQDHSDNNLDASGVGTPTLSTNAFTGSCTTTVLYWATEGGELDTTTTPGGQPRTYSKYFENGDSDLEIDISGLVELWLSNDSDSTTGRPNYGLAVYLHSDQEDAIRSFYTKKFHARNSEFFFKRPTLEARWDSSKKDDAGNFYLSSSLLSDADNLNTLYLYNVVKGRLKNIPNLTAPGFIKLSVYETLGKDAITLPADHQVVRGVLTNNDMSVTGGYVSTGIYSASFAYTGSLAMKVYPVWHTGTSDIAHYNTLLSTGSLMRVNKFNASDYNPKPSYVSNITNLKSTYSPEETARIRLYVREKDWNPTIYSVASTDIENSIIEDAYYKVVRIIDDRGVINYGTGSASHTLMSYDALGNYFDLDMSMLEAGYAYKIKLLYKVSGKYVEQQEVFKFRVE